jgi:hypothetical protein
VVDGSNLGLNDVPVVTKVWHMMLSNTRTLTPTIVNELWLGTNLFDNDFLTSQFTGVQDISGSFGIPGLDTRAQAASGHPSMGFNGFTAPRDPEIASVRSCRSLVR